jgi:hypothetical protein
VRAVEERSVFAVVLETPEALLERAEPLGFKRADRSGEVPENCRVFQVERA